MAQPYKGYINALTHDPDFRAVYTTYGTKDLDFLGKSVVILNDGANDITVTINGLEFIVKGGAFYGTATGEAVELNAGDFKSFTIAGDTDFRCWVRGV